MGLPVVDTPEAQQRLHLAGLRRLVVLGTPDPTRWVISHLSNPEKLALAASPYASVPALLADARLAAVGELIRRSPIGPVRDEAVVRPAVRRGARRGSGLHADGDVSRGRGDPRSARDRDRRG